MEPYTSEDSDKLWGLVDNIVTDSGVGYSQSWYEAVVSWLNAHYILPEGYNSYFMEGPASVDTSYFNVSEMTFI